jgi:phosphoribosylaminoimidazole-succinocarboxamide synthase
MDPLLQIDLPGVRKVKSGKVREMFDLGDRYLLVATDRISAFDCIMPNGIPQKGEVLTRISHFWFDRMEAVIANHRLGRETDPLPAQLKPFAAQLANRSMVVRKARPLPVECVVRGYLAGSGWKEYQRMGTICGIKLPPGLKESAELPEPVFTPATKAQSGHDENISFEQACQLAGRSELEQARQTSLTIYNQARSYARQRGIIIADTKMEFGLWEGKLILIDELLTPDSSRFWPADEYEPGRSQRSYDKQFLRDYLESLTWDKRPPAPALPAEIVRKTRERYLEAYQQLTGRELSGTLGAQG